MPHEASLISTQGNSLPRRRTPCIHSPHSCHCAYTKTFIGKLFFLVVLLVFYAFWGGYRDGRLSKYDHMKNVACACIAQYIARSHNSTHSPESFLIESFPNQQ